MAGERGINLSGGQRQRVCLARAAYHDAQLVLLDNPLSAVDQHTSKHIFDKCIKGLLKEKAVVLIAHQLELLPQVCCQACRLLCDARSVRRRCLVRSACRCNSKACHSFHEPLFCAAVLDLAAV
jgi:ABC-type Mn2+/Zn2+ transport system ATPase subunit